MSSIVKGLYSLSALIAEVECPGVQWWLTVVYSPQHDDEKVLFLEELSTFRSQNAGQWMLCGAFNMIYRAEDKSNGRLDHRNLRRFRTFLDRSLLEELHLAGHRFTWPNERDLPTLERLDQVFATTDLLASFSDHGLKALSSDCSDHSPLLLTLNIVPWAKRRFRFQSF